MMNLADGDVDDVVAELAEILEMGGDDLDDEESLAILRRLKDHIKSVVEEDPASPEREEDDEDKATKGASVGTKMDRAKMAKEKSPPRIRKPEIPKTKPGAESTTKPKSSTKWSSKVNPLKKWAAERKGPTPYDLWARTHVVVTEEKSPTALDERKWDGLVSRLNDGAERHFQTLTKQQQKLAEELSGLNFNPKIDSNSRKMAEEHGVAPLSERLKDIKDKTQRKITAMKKAADQKEMLAATGKPNTTAPCSCGVGIGLDPTDKVEELTDSELRTKHTKFCWRLMTASHAKSNLTQSKTISRGRSSVQSTGPKSKNLEKLRQENMKTELENLTFHPKLNPSTDKILDRMIKEGRGPRPRTKVEFSAKDPGHADEVFSPKIVSRSSNVKLEETNVYSRLAGHAKSSTAKRNKAIAEGLDESVNHKLLNTSSLTPRYQKSKRSSMLLEGETSESASLAEEDKTVLGEMEASTLEYINMVPYKADYGFIVLRLAEPAI